jgi:hypothetical protein
MTSDNFTGWRKATYSHANSSCIEVGVGWRKATYSHANSDCVEVAARRKVVGVRDTVQRGHGPVLQFSAAAWQAFVDAAKSQYA